MKRKQFVSRLELFKLNMGGHFKSANCSMNMDAIWLDSRQYKRLQRARVRASKNFEELRRSQMMNMCNGLKPIITNLYGKSLEDSLQVNK